MRKSAFERITLVLDASGSTAVQGALLQRDSTLAVFTAPRRPERWGDVLRVLAGTLAAHRLEPAQICRCVVVEGPGPFSALRLTAVLANMWGFATRARLAVTRQQPASGNWTATLPGLLARAHPVPSVRPRYGRPPNITKPRRIQYRARKAEHIPASRGQ